jgi:hypothetical protein
MKQRLENSSGIEKMMDVENKFKESEIRNK